MIKFFRNIRQRLLSQNKFSKYLIYATGEILLVMIGILLALQVNNWNEQRKEGIKETKLLNDLAENLEFNLNTLDNIISDFKADDGSSDLIIAVIENKKPYHDSLDYHFPKALHADPLYPLSFIAYESLRNTGFDVVRNDQLKKEIINLFEFTYGIVQLRHNYLPVIDDFIRKRFMVAPDVFRYKPFDFDELIEDREFHSMINNLKSTRRWIRRTYEESHSESQRVLQLIKDELNE